MSTAAWRECASAAGAWPSLTLVGSAECGWGWQSQSQMQEGTFNGPRRRPAAGGWHKQKRWLVINTMTHA